MSGVEASDDEVCASCGKAAVDNIKLKNCTACKLVKYCGVDCQKNHRPQHKKACKKRAAQIRDDKLFTQPDECYHGECPICCLPLSLDKSKTVMKSCCSKLICRGCSYANYVREIEHGLDHSCPYCREPLLKTEEEGNQCIRKRAKVNDPVAICGLGNKCHLEGDYQLAVKYHTKAAELGNADAHYGLALSYSEGKGVERDLKKKIYHLEEAALGGHPEARFKLGCHEGRNGRFDRMVKHYVIAANLGLDEAVEAVKEGFVDGYVSKDDYEAALRGHQAAVDATKSQQRDAAEEYYKRRNQE